MSSSAIQKISDEIENLPEHKQWFWLIYNKKGDYTMKIKVIVHEAEEGGFWAEVPSFPGCATQGDTFEELLQNLYDAIKGCLSVDI